VLIDVRSDKDKAKAGVPQLPSNSKNKLISVPYAVLSSLEASTRLSYNVLASAFSFFFIATQKSSRCCALRLEDLPSKLKGMVRNAKKAEAEIAALKISYLKKIGKGSNVIIMDSSVHPNHLQFFIPIASAFQH
jgi:hypothetical protein